MRFAVIAQRSTATNEALVGAAATLGLDSAVLPPRDALRFLEPGDVALGRLDVREGLDGIESGTRELERLAEAGIDVLNPSGALALAHDKLLTARALRLAGLPHPHSWLIAPGQPSPAPELPLVLKPRFGSWGRDVMLCRTREELDDALAEIAPRGWFREHGALAQELVPPQGWDLRIVVAGGRIVGAALLPTRNGYVIAELNGAVDIRLWYSLDGDDVHAEAVLELLRTARDRRVLAASQATVTAHPRLIGDG
jgi:glutathione synthase/RimK-type ligase-like ATP-grasp enzyme